MKQIAVLPSGVQNQNKGSILYFDDTKILYASTLAVYVLNAKSFMLEKILSLNVKAISSITVSPHDSNLMVVGASDASVCMWNINDEEVLTRINTLNGPVLALWDPFSPTHCAILSNDVDLKLYYWDVRKTSGGCLLEMFSIKTPNVKHTVAKWNPQVEGQIAIGCNNGAVVIFNHIDKSQKVLMHLDPSTAVPGNTNNKEVVPAQLVVDIQFDRLSVLYMLVAYSYFISLWDLESGTEIHVFDKQNIAITSIAWMDWTAGNFLSTNAKNSTFKIWNASQKAPLEVIKITNTAKDTSSNLVSSTSGAGGGHSMGIAAGQGNNGTTFSGGGLQNNTDTGIHSITFCPASQRVLTAANDGAICVYHLTRKLLEFTSYAGHNETIFDCKFSPVNANLLSSCGFDGTIKLWNIHDMSLIKTISGNSDVIYSLDYSPKGNMIACSTFSGLIIIYDIETSRELARYLHHIKASYCVQWCKLDDSLIASTSSDMNLIIMAVNSDKLYDINNGNVSLGSRRKGDNKKDATPSEVRYKFKHPSPVFGCAWCPNHAPILASCCQDGIVRVFNINLKVQLVSILLGHKSRVFSLAWSPLLIGHLATGSDDCNVIVWEVNLVKSMTLDIPDYTHAPQMTPKEVLTGHTMNVRALHWNAEHKHTLLSGSWDSSIRIWDVLTGNCLHVLTDHIADVYALAAHPDRPFTYVSSSRDTSLRVWEMEGIVSRMRLNAVFDCSLTRVLALEGAYTTDGYTEVTQDKTLTEIIHENSSKTPLSKLYQQLPSKFSGIVSGQLQAIIQKISASPENRTILKGIAEGSHDQSDPSHSPSAREMNTSESKSDRFDSTAGSLKRNDAEEIKLEYTRQIPKDPIQLARAYYHMYTFFCGSASGVMDLWEVVLTILTSRQAGNKTLANSSFMSTNSVMSIATGGTTPSVHVKLLRPANLRLIFHESEVLAKAKTEGRRLEAIKGNVPAHLKQKLHNSEATSRTDEALRNAAMCYVRMGDFGKYCALMVEVGDWSAALSMAPAVSHDYWKELAYKYAQHLITSQVQNEQCIPFLLGTGRDIDAVDFYLTRSDVNNALVVSKMSQLRSDLIPDHMVGTGISTGSNNSGQSQVNLKNRFSPVPTPNYPHGRSAPNVNPKSFVFPTHNASGSSAVDSSGVSVSSIEFGADVVECGSDDEDSSPSGGGGGQGARLNAKGLPSVRDRTENEVEESRNVVKGVANYAAKNYLLSGKPIHAAAQLLAVEDFTTALTVLLNNCEYDLAYAVALSLEIDTTPYLIEMADRCAALNAIDLAVDMLCSLPSRNIMEIEIGLLCSRYCSENKHNEIIKQKGLKSANVWLELAREEEAIGSDADAVMSFTIARKFGKAVNIGLNVLKRFLREPWDLSMATKKLLRGLKYVNATELEESLKLTFLCTMLWFSAHEAFSLTLYDTASSMLILLIDYAFKAQFVIATLELKLQSLFVLIYGRKKKEALQTAEMIIRSEFRNGSTVAQEHMRVFESTENLVGLLTDKPHSTTANANALTAKLNTTNTTNSTGLKGNITEGMKLEQCWGQNTNSIIREINIIADQLNLPSLSSTQSTKRSTASNLDKLTGGSTTGGVLLTQSVLQGSLLPAANQTLKSLVSAISCQRIHSSAILLSEQGTPNYASANEIAAWKRVNPFSPLMNGDTIGV